MPSTDRNVSWNVGSKISPDCSEQREAAPPARHGRPRRPPTGASATT